MARTRTAVFLLLTYSVCAANCRFDEVKYNQALEIMENVVNVDNASIRILVIGKVGVGKSTLVNALVGKEIAKTGGTVESVTKTVELKEETTMNGIRVHICDTPGLGDADKKDGDTLLEALRTCKDIDLFLFCMEMEKRIERLYIEGIELVSSVFGQGIWKRGMFVLTFANKYNEKDKFIHKQQEWENELRKRMKTAIDPEVAKTIPIVPAGHREPQLPDRESWISEFWVQGYRRMNFKAMLYLYLLNSHRIHSTTDGMNASHKNPEDQPLLTCHMSKETRYIDPKYYADIGEVIGGTIGLLVSAALPGIPSSPITMALSYCGKWVGTFLYDSIGKEDETRCHNEALMRSLIATFVEEYPSYREKITTL